MLLSKPDITRAIEEKRLRFEPPVDPARVEQVSIDLLLGRRITRLKEPPRYITSFRLDPSIWESQEIWNHEERDSFTLNPGDFVLGQTLEFVSIPNNLVGLIEGRSSYARLGLSVHLTAPKIDPGFNGQITLEMANHGRLPIELRAGVDRLAQLMLLPISSPLDVGELYGAGLEHAFQYQTEPIPRRRRPEQN